MIVLLTIVVCNVIGKEMNEKMMMYMNIICVGTEVEQKLGKASFEVMRSTITENMYFFERT